jgi:hypothetical protein
MNEKCEKYILYWWHNGEYSSYDKVRSSSKVYFFFSGMEAGRNVKVVGEDLAVLKGVRGPNGNTVVPVECLWRRRVTVVFSILKMASFPFKEQHEFPTLALHETHRDSSMVRGQVST